MVPEGKEKVLETEGFRVLQDNQKRVNSINKVMRKKCDNSLSDMIEKMIGRGYVVRIGKIPGHGFHASAVTMRTDQENRFVEGSGVSQVIEELFRKITKGKR